MPITEDAILAALSQIIEPDLKKDIVELDLVREVTVDENTVHVSVEVSNPALHSRKRMEEAVVFNLKKELGKGVDVKVTVSPLSGDRGNLRKVLPHVKHIIAVASGKGGVGKSTITANLAVGLAQRGLKVGLVDADIHGPSMPIMFDVVNERPQTVEKDGKHLIIPVESHGVKLLSIGFFAAPDQAIAWRGPMASKALEQLFKDADWGELDLLLVDLPPGTGDIHLSLVQAVPLTGAIIVSTPQPVALADARKGVGLFRMPSVNVPVLGIVENMAWFTPAELPNNKYYIFGKGGARALAGELNVPFLGEVPLVQSIREAGDVGRPAVLQPNTVSAVAFNDLCNAFQERMAKVEQEPKPAPMQQPA
ncbi:MAG: Mrp/NBP35 family ATP-binding protein [Flavobacteriales bacterium]|nr:Mrp/NBP35 family ATP-binding protein [Flavobacteriales bacterium]MBK6943833.1 Mrp/NBP35 family ATP-binding protein [Flavobacteriales bacterium]MBK7240042.1 Mrp/NBP35 family ATP-binding protein [Flavobacteriales bacterium]MBK7297092.1 Mrp/NBP35 family ATP-binding protein [Flavobacteriales bacterium]MBK9535635.1 Mrp/NBP35 family ATP-binding protein [Flavobacteriales bacterium]